MTGRLEAEVVVECLTMLAIHFNEDFPTLYANLILFVKILGNNFNLDIIIKTNSFLHAQILIKLYLQSHIRTVFTIGKLISYLFFISGKEFLKFTFLILTPL